MALALDVQLPRYAAPPKQETRATLWIASDYPPLAAQSWPVLVPIPVGYHEVSEEEAQAIISGKRPTLSFVLGPPADDAASVVAALSTAEPDAAVVANRRPSRAPREPRAPRKARPARSPRYPRVFAPERPPRPPRKARTPRKPRPPRKARTPRPKNYKTRQKPGVCKGPSCDCWTPAGCVGDWYLELLPWFKDSGCYRGPCYSYEACTSEKCQYHPACFINQIIQFWARQYRAAVTYAAPVIATLPAPVQRALLPRPRPTGGVAPVPEGPQAPAGAVKLGCPTGWYWTIGLTGCRCVEPGSGLVAATRAQVIACIGQAEWDRLVSLLQQGQTA